jgi:hypothetical protein
MPAYDTFHEAVKRGLIKDGWTITDDPYAIEFGKIDMYIDLAAERMIAAERGNELIAVEIKSFLGPSLLTNFHSALGQFINYRTVLQHKDPGRSLYLAVPKSVHYEFFSHILVQEVVRNCAIQLIVFDPEEEVLEQWIK